MNFVKISLLARIRSQFCALKFLIKMKSLKPTVQIIINAEIFDESQAQSLFDDLAGFLNENENVVIAELWIESESPLVPDSSEQN